MKLTRDQKLAQTLARQARKDGFLDESQLDSFLDVKRGYDKRVEALIRFLGATPLVPAPDRGEASQDQPIRPRLPMTRDNDSLRRYLRQVNVRPRLAKPDELRMARRLEFARRRFQKAVVDARIAADLLREVLGGEYSRTYAQDLDLPVTSKGRARALSDARQREIRDRAFELNRNREDFVLRNLAMVVDLCLSYRTYGVPIMDLVQEGNGAMIRAVEKYDWRKDVRFQTYATFWVRQAVERSIAFNRGIVRVPNYLQQKMRRLRREGVIPRGNRDVSVREVSDAFEVKPEVAGHLLQTERSHYSLDLSIDEDGETFASLLEDEGAGLDSFRMEFELLKERIAEVMESLGDLEREILQLRFGLNGCTPMTLEEVGSRMNVSRERIRQIQVRAIRKLQRPGLINRLAGFA